MNVSSDSAEQIVRLSLEGLEIIAKISGEGAKNIAILLYTMLKDQKQTKGKTNLTNMLRTGKELKIFSVKREDLKKFTNQANKYGVLFSALVDKKKKDKDSIVDIMVRAEDAPKVNRIMERYNLLADKSAMITTEIESSLEDSKEGEEKTVITDDMVDYILGKKEKEEIDSPSSENIQSENLLENKKNLENKKVSVKEELNEIKEKIKTKQKENISKDMKAKSKIKITNKKLGEEKIR